MTLLNAIEHFKKLLSKTSKKSEIRVYNEFIKILGSLDKNNLSDVETQSIEEKLDSLDLNLAETSNKMFYNQALKQFKHYLKDYHSFTSKGYYTNLGIGLGASFGVLAGVVFLSGLERSLGISLGISFGMLIGLIIGRNIDLKAKVSGNTY